MKAKAILLSIIILASFTETIRGDRPLEQTEISQILQTLTNRQIKAWISSGTISATHVSYRAPKTTDPDEINDGIAQAIQAHLNEAKNSQVSAEVLKMKLDAIPFNVRYKMSNKSTMYSDETVKYDGNRFYWEIDVSSRSDSVTPGPELAGNSMTRHFNLAWNRRRVFAWNGYEYTLYSRSNNSAFVDADSTLPRSVNGPLTAGLIPWGYGQYSYASLAGLKSSAVEQQINGRTEIHLTLDETDGSRLVFVLDADNDYAVISHSAEDLNTTVSRYYTDYRSIAGVQVPTTVEIESYDAKTNRLLASDSWYITSVSTEALSVGDFIINYENGAQIEYKSALMSQTAIYDYSSRLDPELLLAERLSFAASQDRQKNNCATAALGYAALRLGRDISEAQLARLVDRQTGQSNLLAMKEFVHRQGLYCRAVRTDIRTLKSLTDCQVILHIPHKNHFVLLGDIDNDYIWTIDLTGRRFCRRADVAFFGMDWTQGTALLISKAPITGDLDDIDQVTLENITGRAGWTCTELLQEKYVQLCEYVDDQCTSAYIYEPDRWGCEEAESGMCIQSGMLRQASCPCVGNTLDPYSCEVNGDWDLGYMDACS